MISYRLGGSERLLSLFGSLWLAGKSAEIRSEPRDHKQQPQDMRGRGPGRRGVRLFTDFWRENLNFPALSITNRRGGGRGGGRCVS